MGGYTASAQNQKTCMVILNWLGVNGCLSLHFDLWHTDHLPRVYSMCLPPWTMIWANRREWTLKLTYWIMVLNSDRKNITIAVTVVIVVYILNENYEKNICKYFLFFLMFLCVNYYPVNLTPFLFQCIHLLAPIMFTSVVHVFLFSLVIIHCCYICIL